MKICLKNNRRAVSPVIATLLLIAIAVAAAIIVYAFVTGLIGGLTSSSGSSLITATASLTVPSGNGPGILVISVTNNANSPITGIQVAYTVLTDSLHVGVTCMGETQGDVSCIGAAAPAACGSVNAGAAATTTVPFCNAAAVIIQNIAADELAVGGQTSASENVLGAASANLLSGTSYSMIITVDFANGGTHSQPLSATAEI